MLVFIGLAAGTGSVLAFRAELDRWLNPELFVVAPRGTPATLDEMFALVEAVYPDVIVSSITLPTRPDESAAFFLRAPRTRTRQRGQVDTLQINTVFVDPYARRVMGHRSSLAFAWSRAAVMPVLLRFHYTLLMQRTGLWVMGVCAGAWLLTNFLGMALAWPKAWRRVESWRRVVAVDVRHSTYRMQYDLHRSLGVWLLPVLSVMAFTSVYLSFPIGTRQAIGRVLPLTPPLTSTPLQGVPILSPQMAMNNAMRAVPDAEPRSMFREPGSGWYSIRLRQPGDVAPYGNSQVYVSMATGDIVATRLPADASVGDTVINWLRPLHTGGAFGLPGRFILAIVGLLTILIGVTSAYTYLVRSSRTGDRADRVSVLGAEILR